MPRRPLARCLLIALAAARPAVAAPATQPASLPVTGVTLYTSGVGFFRHDGIVAGDGGVTLKFKTAQINDVLKSLVVQDDGGRVTGVQYPSQDPLDKTLKTFQIDLTGNPTLSDLLSQLRGATVTLTARGEAHFGTIVGIEKKQVPQPPPAPARESAVLNLLETGSFTQYDLDTVSAIHLTDKTLNDDLDHALAAVAAGRDQDKKPVTIRFAGDARQTLHVGYVVETPVWKTAYRLLLKSGASAATQPKTDLQGWAVVENQTDSDWDDVSLSLVSGRPISFVMDLYQPIYLNRPTVQLDLFAGLRPQVYQEGVQNHAFAADAISGSASAEAKPAARADRAGLQKAARLGVNGSVDWSSRGWAGAQQDDLYRPVLTAKLGALFKYTIDHVSLPRQQSSLVPIVTDPVTAEPVSIYNQTVLPRNPLNGVVLTNTTGKLLPQGPLTVFDGGVYAGDAQIEDLPAGEKRLLSYGVDLQTFVAVTDSGTTELVGGKINKGLLVLSRRQSQAKSYAVENKSDAARTVVVENELLNGWHLVDTPDPMEKTDVRYRFRVPVAAGKAETLKVTQERTVEEASAVMDNSVTALLATSREGALPQKVRDALADAAKRQQAITDLETQAKQKQSDIDAIGTEQQRLRDNMKVVDKNGKYYGRLLAKLNDQESQIETLQKDKDELTEKAQQARQDYSKYLDGLTVG